MEKTMDRELKNLVNELTQGKELTYLLRKNLQTCSSSPQARQVLVDKLLGSYDRALSMLNWSRTTASVVETKPTSSTLESPASVTTDKKDVSKKRKTSSVWTEQLRVCSGTSLEGPLDDGYCWRKYGQKDILGSTFPRGYYRCTHRHSQGCLATKQVQRSDEDPTIFEVKYRGRHTCKQAYNFAVMSCPPVTGDSKEKDDHYRKNQQQQQTQETFLSFESGVMVKAEDFENNREDSIIFPSFDPSPDDLGNDSGIFVKSLMENDIIGNLSPAFVSPATSDQSNYFSVSPCHMGSFGLGYNVQTSESDLTEIISAPTSVTNSPIGDLDFASLDKLEFDTSFPFDNSDFFS